MVDIELVVEEEPDNSAVDAAGIEGLAGPAMIGVKQEMELVFFAGAVEVQSEGSRNYLRCSHVYNSCYIVSYRSRKLVCSM